MDLSNDQEALAALFKPGQTFIDVRSPGEFLRAHIPNSINEPLLVDGERAAVGLDYRLHGAASAIALGHSIVTGDIKERRIDAWQRCISVEGATVLFCARGGLRSEIACRWLAERGIALPRINGGYKAIRRALLEWFTTAIPNLPLLIVSGQTGVGKTRFLNMPAHGCNSVDLEGLARHCGSSFGAIHGAQPSQATFENSLFVAALRADDGGSLPILVEDESRRVGAITLPPLLLRRIATAPRIVLTRPMAERIEIIKDDYIHSVLARASAESKERGMAELEAALTGALQRIGKRLGDQRLRLALTLLKEGFTVHRAHDDSSAHNRWIELLLTEYYDPSYARQLRNCQETIIAEGSERELIATLRCRSLDLLRTTS